MALMNAKVWFAKPFSWQQIISWICLLGSAILAVHGFYMLKSVGAPQGGIEATTILVQRGAYRFVRHPVYAALLLCGIGVFFKQPSLVNTAFLISLLAFLTMTGRNEESENLSRFGHLYAEYTQRTRMFVPFIY